MLILILILLYMADSKFDFIFFVFVHFFIFLDFWILGFGGPSRARAHIPSLPLEHHTRTRTHPLGSAGVAEPC